MPTNTVGWMMLNARSQRWTLTVNIFWHRDLLVKLLLSWNSWTQSLESSHGHYITPGLPGGSSFSGDQIWYWSLFTWPQVSQVAETTNTTHCMQKVRNFHHPPRSSWVGVLMVKIRYNSKPACTTARSLTPNNTTSELFNASSSRVTRSQLPNWDVMPDGQNQTQ